MLSMNKVIALIAWPVVLLGWAVTVSQAQVDYSALNAALGAIDLEIDTSTVEPIAITVVGSVEATITFDPTATCVGLALDRIDVTYPQAKLYPREDVDGQELERYDVGIFINDLRFSCTIRVCITLGVGCGLVTVIGDANSDVDVNLEQELYSEDFSTLPPIISRDKDTACTDKVQLDGATFEAESFSYLGFIPISGIIEGQLNGGSKQTAIEPIADALCEQLANITASINTLVVDNPFSNATQFSLGQNLTIGEEASIAEQTLQANLPASVDLIDIGDNFLINTLLGGAQNGSLILDPESTLVETALGAFNISTGNDTSAVLALVDSLLGTDIASTNGDFEDLDLLESLSNLLPNITDMLALDIDLATLSNSTDSDASTLSGTVNATVTGLFLSATPTSDQVRDVYSFDLLGEQTIATPIVDLGDLVLRAEIRLDLDVSTVVFETSTVALNLGDDFTIALGWQDFLAQAAVFLPIDGNGIPELEIGGLLRALVDCLLSLFVQSPMITAAFVNSDGIDLFVGNVSDGVIKALGDLINALSPAFQGVVPGALTLAAESLIINETFLDPLPGCPVTLLDANTTQPFSLQENPLLESINGLVSLESVNDALSGLTGSSGLLGETGNGTLELFPEQIDLFEGELPQLEGQAPVVVSLAVSSLALEGIVPPDLSELNLFNVSEGASSYFPQGLYNAITAGSAEQPITVSANLVLRIKDGLGEAGSVVSDNELRVALGAQGLQFILELFLAFSIFDVEATQIGDALDLDCWLAKLDPYGGVKQLVLRLISLDIDIDCFACDNVILADFSGRLSDPANAEVFVSAIDVATGMLGSVVTNAFDEGLWNSTIANADARCAGTGTGSLFDDIFGGAFSFGNETILPSSEQDLDATYAFVGMFFSVLGFAGILTCGCRVGPSLRLAKTGLREQFQIDPDVPKDETKGGRPISLGAGVADSVNPLKRVSMDSDLHQVENTPLWRHPSIPAFVRYMVPFTLVLNLAMFLLGHIDVVLQTDLVGSVAGIPVALDNFAELSVIETVQTLIEGGAYALAFLIGGFSVVWPYIKLICVALCWFSPTRRISFKRRGSVLRLLDQLGKWSFVELYFVAFVKTLLKIDIASPAGNALLPENAFTLSIVIDLLFNLYTFTAALLLSLFVSNLAMIYHERIEDSVLEEQRMRAGKADTDHTPLSLRDYLLERRGENGVLYRAALTQLGALLVLFGILASIALIGYAGTLPVLELKVFGLARPLMEFSNEPTTIPVTFYSFLQDSFAIQDIGVQAFGAVVVSTVLLIPLVQMLMLIMIPFVHFTLRGANRFLEINQVLCAWSATEVFVLAIAVTTLELKTVSEFLVEENCEFLNPILINVLYPTGLFNLTERDVEASCFGMEASVEIGAYLFFAGLVITNFVHLFITKLFKAYIDNRKHSAVHFENESHSQHNVTPEDLPIKIGCGLRSLKAFGLLSVEKSSNNGGSALSPLV